MNEELAKAIDAEVEKKVAARVAEALKRTPEPDGPVRIFVMDRGWVLVGRLVPGDDDDITASRFIDVESASVIRRWGTTNGLGQLAETGPVAGETVLDKEGRVSVATASVQRIIKCASSAWAGKL